MPSALDFAQIGSQLGSQAFGTMNAFENAKTKMGLLLSQQAAQNAHAQLFGAQADSIRQRQQYQTPEFASTIGAQLAGLTEPQAADLSSYQKTGSWGTNPAYADETRQMSIGPTPRAAPDWATPETINKFQTGQAAHLLNLGATGDSNANQLADAFAKLRTQGRVDQAIAQPSTAGIIGSGVAAGEGRPLYHQGPGGVMQQFTGAETLNDIGRSAVLQNRAQANNANASAGAHNAAAELSRSKVGQQPSMVMGLDGVPVEVSTKPTKPMPTAALKLQQEELDAIGAASGLESDLGAVLKQVQSGSLALGPLENLKSKTRNFAGASTENSRNFSSFQSTLERLRNESLRLNKGVQTEGDAVRAWNELVANISDPQVVEQRLGEIIRVNQRAAALRQNNVEVIRNNFAQPALDVGRYTNQPAALGGNPGNPGIPPSPAQDRTSALSEARAALAAGAPRAAVIQRLREMGIKDGSI